MMGICGYWIRTGTVGALDRVAVVHVCVGVNFRPFVGSESRCARECSARDMDLSVGRECK